MTDRFTGNRLLVIDDEPAYAAVVKKVSEQVGFEVTITANAFDCVAFVASWRPSVIVLDLRLPDIDGIQILRALAEDKYAGHLIVSSGADHRILDAATRLGRERGLKMSGILQKPVRVEFLQELFTGLFSVPKTLLSADLAEAITAHQLFLEYQPKFDCRLGKFTGVEALARWRHPQHGVIRPDEFIPLAEQGDLIHSVTDWAVSRAAGQAAAWQRENLLLDIAVNISARDLEDLALPERLERHCRDAGTDPSAIILELTETSAMRDAAQMMDVLTRLRLKDFRLAIDDFGTGYSSLVQLQRLPFSELKIDKSFVMHMSHNHDCRVIAKIVIDLARELGLTSVAEGVEDETALMTLVDMGCHVAQGYYLSRPVSAERVAELIRGNTVMDARQPVAA